MARPLAKPPVEVTQADLLRAFRECGLLNTTFDAAMKVPGIALSLRRMAECQLRRQLRLQEQLRADRKRAQANDVFDREDA